MRRITVSLSDDEYAFVLRVARLFRCSLSKVLTLFVSLARQNQSFIKLLNQLESAFSEHNEAVQHGSMR